MIEFYADTRLRPARGPLLDEAHRLHRERRFAGSVVLFYSQIEGVLTDALVELGHATTTIGGVVAGGGGKLPGLDAKLKLAKEKLEEQTAIFQDLREALLVASDMETTVPKSRNAVLHGSDVDFATEARSTQMCLWLGAILVELRPVLSVTEVVTDAEREPTHPAP